MRFLGRLSVKEPGQVAGDMDALELEAGNHTCSSSTDEYRVGQQPTILVWWR